MEKLRIKASDVAQAQQDYADLKREYLREAGWSETCDTPGSYWLWSGTLPDGRAVLCDKATAVALQAAIDPPEEEPDDDLP